MKFVSVRDLRGRSGQIWKQLAAEKEMVITSNGKPVAMLSAVSEDTLEESVDALRRARAMAAVEAMHGRSLRAGAGRMKLGQINTEIAAVRKRRAK